MSHWVNKIDKVLPRQTKKEKNNQVTKSEMKVGTFLWILQNKKDYIIAEYYKQLGQQTG